MPRRSNKPIFNFNLPHFTQISESHCGPAVVQMLLSNLGIEVTQEEVAEAAGVADMIEMHGTRVDQLALAVRRIAPQARFWYKRESRFADLVELVKKHRYPVGVEWQGLFEDPEEGEIEPETEDSDYGHYSVVTHIDMTKRQLIIADPYKDFISQARIFSFSQFRERWYDYNEVTNPQTGEPELVEDYHMMFIITPRSAVFPLDLGMKTDDSEGISLDMSV